MNLSKLFKAQKKLDDRIVKEKGLEGQDLLDEKILALQVELGELANEWRGFKFWSEDQEPRTEHVCVLCDGNRQIERFIASWDPNDGYDQIEVEVDCPLCEGYDSDKNPLLEEYVDCLHFILSIGLELNIPVIYVTETKWDELTSDETDITQQFLLVFENVNKLVHPIDWINLFEEFYILGEMLGFTWEQVEKAYFDKNKVNHERQENGY